MFLVVDANVLFALAGKGKVRKLFKQLWNKGIKPITPEFGREELLKIKEDLVKFAGFSETEEFIEALEKFVKIIPKSQYERFLNKAKKISPDVKDVPYFAISLKFGKAPIWSRDKRLKRQKVVEVLTDAEVEKRYLK